MTVSEQNTIFNAPAADNTAVAQQAAAPAQQAAPSTTALPDGVAEFIGEGKKYRSVEEALKSVPHAQAHIDTLQKELAELREKAAKASAAEELLDELKRQQTGVQQPTIDPSDILGKVDSLVEQKLQQQKQLETAKANQARVADAFRESFGDKAEEQYVAIANSTGLDVSYLNSLAAKSPEAVLKLAGITASKQTTASKTASSISTEAFISAPKPNQPVKSIMYGASTADMVNAWRAVKPQL